MGLNWGKIPSSQTTANVAFSFTPFIGGTSILVSWLIMLAFIRPKVSVLGAVFRDTFRQMWGALLVGVFIFGLAYVFNYSGMGASLATGFSKVGPWFILLAPILGWTLVLLGWLIIVGLLYYFLLPGLMS